MATARHSFLRWYLLHRPWEIAVRYSRGAAIIAEFFSFFFLARTLFSPWKGIQTPLPKYKLNLQALAEALSVNLITRSIGAFIRFVAMAAGFLCEIIFLAVFVLYLIAWILAPVLLIVALPLLLYISF